VDIVTLPAGTLVRYTTQRPGYTPTHAPGGDTPPEPTPLVEVTGTIVGPCGDPMFGNAGVEVALDGPYAGHTSRVRNTHQVEPLDGGA
jgi:hypothetical protein